MNLMNLIINFTPTGMIPTKAMTPHVPISISEIVEDVHEAFELGITMVHLHARDESSGEATYKAEVYRRIIKGIRKFSNDLVICVSLSGIMRIRIVQKVLNAKQYLTEHDKATRQVKKSPNPKSSDSQGKHTNNHNLPVSQ